MENFVILRKNPDYEEPEIDKMKKKWERKDLWRHKQIGMEWTIMVSNEVKIA